jgi:hypothetical protein
MITKRSAMGFYSVSVKERLKNYLGSLLEADYQALSLVLELLRP